MARSSLSKISYLCCAGSRALDMKLHGWCCPSSFNWYSTPPVATREASVSTKKGLLIFGSNSVGSFENMFFNVLKAVSWFSDQFHGCLDRVRTFNGCDMLAKFGMNLL